MINVSPEWMRAWLLAPRIKILCNIEPVLFSLQASLTVANSGGAWRLSGKVGAFRPGGRRFESHPSRPFGTLGKSFTHSCLWCFVVLTPHSINAVVENACVYRPSSGLDEAT